jgi:AcrR family transcriptional regulator
MTELGPDHAADRRRRGRWRSGLQSRQRILAAARSAFARDGFERTTLRAVAAEAGVDPAEIHYFFKTKEGLFTAAMTAPAAAKTRIAELLADGVEQLAPRLLAHVLSRWDAAGDVDPLIALTRSAPTHGGSAAMLRDVIHEQIGAHLTQVLHVGDIELRLGLFSSQLLGLLMTRYVLRTEPMASAHPETLVAWLGPVLQSYLTGPAPSPESGRPDAEKDEPACGLRH